MTIERVTVTNAHGLFSVEPAALDRAIARYLPSSIQRLRRIVKEVCGWDAADVHSVSELLMALADAQG